MTAECFCGGYGKYTDYNCGESFDVTCPHCRGTGTKKCDCTKASLDCNGIRGQEVIEDKRTKEQIEDDDIHWNFMD